ncbi:glycine-rich domain-containing protein [Sulfurivermis fontis]|uniref:glycine-rich domain-containing protein n=1 Tax=Sulfurivermis fontis TaxID=1972068 RepID=UPI000FDCA1DB|nr:hypothetical protein [Sulfurivermis fontis]
MEVLYLLALAAMAMAAGRLGRSAARRRRAAYIDDFAFHPAVLNKLREVRPGLTTAQEELVLAALRDYFHLCNMAGRRMVAMPSQVVDDAWHAFILFTRAYEQFCRRAFGRFLHHTPAEAMAAPTLAQDGIRRAWRLACARDGIDPKQPLRLPLLFSIDSDLAIPNGFRYTLDCAVTTGTQNTGSYCASHIGCGGSGCSGGLGDGAGCGGDGGGGCGGD